MNPFPPLFNPFYHGLLRLFGYLSGGHPAAALLALNLICAVLSLLLLVAILRMRSGVQPEAAEGRVLLASFRQALIGSGGVVVVLSWILGFPFLSSVAAPGPQWMDVVLILACAWALFRFDKAAALGQELENQPIPAAERRNYTLSKAPGCSSGAPSPEKFFAWFSVFAFLCGLSVLESAACFLAMPLFFCWFLVVVVRHWAYFRFSMRGAGGDARKPDRTAADSVPPGKSHAWYLAGPVISFGLGLVPFLAYAVWYSYQPVFAWREFKGVGEVLGEMVRVHALNILAGIPKVGWLTILILYVVPFLYLLIWPPRLHRRRGYKRTLLIHLALTALVVASLGFPFFFEDMAYRLASYLLLPSLLTSLALGVLTGAWRARLGRELNHEPLWLQRNRRMMRPLVLPMAALLVLASGAVSIRALVRGHSPWPAQFASDVAAGWHGQEWLLSDGIMDEALADAAAKSGLPVKILSPTMFHALPYRRWVVSELADQREQRMAILSLPALLSYWLDHDPNIQSRLAVLSSPALWLAGGLPFTPKGMLYLAREMTPTDLADQKACWTRYLPVAEGMKDQPEKVRTANQAILDHVSRLANNTGWLLEGRGEIAEAREAYAMARRLNPGNISAALNLLAVDKSAPQPDQDLTTEVEALVRSSQSSEGLYSLAQVYGYVRQPGDYLARGWAWVSSGLPVKRKERWPWKRSQGRPGISYGPARLSTPCFVSLLQVPDKGFLLFLP